MNWRDYVVPPHASILDVMRLIDREGSRFALVADENAFLLGAVTDGNIRRALVGGLTLQERIDAVMNPAPLTASPLDTSRSVLRRMQKEDVTHIPVVDAEGKLVDLWSLKELQASPSYDNPVVLMAGGLGSRLGELTAHCPKPMLHIGGKPILEIVLQNFIDCGFVNFFIAVNYKAEQVESYFRDGSKWSAEIEYIKEKKPLGTAGALSLLPQTIDLPVVVMNGDILTSLQANTLVDAHVESSAIATMVVKPYEFQVPYGVVDCTDAGTIIGIREKPVLSFPVSAGINIFSPEAIDTIPYNTRIDMPEIFTELVKSGKQVNTFSIDNYWLDIGRIPDYKRANEEYLELFRKK